MIKFLKNCLTKSIKIIKQNDCRAKNDLAVIAKIIIDSNKKGACGPFML